MIGTTEQVLVRRSYKPVGEVETARSICYGSLPTAVERKAYCTVSRVLRANASRFTYESASSYGSDIYGCANSDQGFASLFFDERLLKAVAKFSDLAKKFTTYGSVLISDADSTVSSPKVDAKLHLYNIKQYEISYSRRTALNYMFHTLEDAFENREVEMLNCLLYSAADELLDSSLSVSLLRATFRARSELAMWSFYRDVVQKKLRDHPDAKKLLRGLIG
ncbi:hypothetical protein [Pseudomonas batumici]|uniref:hypothetical protein n=1 Tax=Pseudomonas batumici TaxID=226910 RepID=UPI0012EDDD94|nr:hypothetical protein [Pseudomonas batumici]